MSESKSKCWYFMWGGNEDTSDSVDSFICSLKYVLFTGMGYGQYNNKYTHNINGDINGMLTSPFSLSSSLSYW